MFPIFHRILFYFLKKETETQIIIYTTIYTEENDNNSDGTRSYFQYFVKLYFYLFICKRELVWEKFQFWQICGIRGKYFLKIEEFKCEGKWLVTCNEPNSNAFATLTTKLHKAARNYFRWKITLATHVCGFSRLQRRGYRFPICRRTRELSSMSM